MRVSGGRLEAWKYGRVEGIHRGHRGAFSGRREMEAEDSRRRISSGVGLSVCLSARAAKAAKEAKEKEQEEGRVRNSNTVHTTLYMIICNRTKQSKILDWNLE